MITLSVDVTADVAGYRRRLVGLFLCGAFGIVCAPMVVANNESLAVLTASHIDSGSIVSSVNDVVQADYACNQNNGFHTSVYGWTYNSLLIAVFALLSLVLRVDFVQYFFVYALAAKAVSLVLSLGCVAVIYRLGASLFRSTWAATVATIIAVCFAPFLQYTFLVHPESAGLCATLGMFLFLGRYLERSATRDYLAACGCFALAVLSKQPFLFAIVPLTAAYFSVHLRRETLGTMIRSRRHWHMALACVGIGVLVVLVVHPFAVFEFDRFCGAQKYMLGAHVMQRIPRGEIVRTWLESIGKHWIVAFGLAASIGHLMAYRFRGSAERRMFSLISLYNVAYLGWLIYSVCPPGTSEYFYPVYPFLALIGVEGIRVLHAAMAERPSWVAPALRVGLAGICLAAVAAPLIQVLRAAAFATNKLAVRHSDPFYVAGRMAELHAADKGSILYSCTLPLPQHTWKQSTNTFQIGGPIDEICDNMKLDFVVVDVQQNWPYEKELKARSELAQLRHVYEISSRFAPYDLEIEQGNDLPLIWRRLKSNLRRLSGASADADPKCVSFKVFARKPIASLKDFDTSLTTTSTAGMSRPEKTTR